MVSASNKDTESIYKESFHSVSLFSVVVKKVNKFFMGCFCPIDWINPTVS